MWLDTWDLRPAWRSWMTVDEALEFHRSRAVDYRETWALTLTDDERALWDGKPVVVISVNESRITAMQGFDMPTVEVDINARVREVDNYIHRPGRPVTDFYLLGWFQDGRVVCPRGLRPHLPFYGVTPYGTIGLAEASLAA